MNCPNCGKKDVEEINISREMMFALLADAGCKTNHKFEYCNCTEEERKQVKFWKANRISKKKAEKLTDLEYRTWLVHRLPEMGDCVRFDYAYYVNPDGRIICKAFNDYYDITEEVLDKSDGTF